VLTRCKRIPGVDRVICAIPGQVENKPLCAEALKHSEVCVGECRENDVLARYFMCAKEAKADIIIRVTGDCPMISPELCGAVVAKLKETGADYASNVEPRRVPKGFDCEAFTMQTLTKAHQAAEPYEREHVTTWMRRAYINRVVVDNFSLDTEDDYRTICAAFGHEPYSDKRLQAA
jgi:spore coat polysaccharide biosynthesis protein SpsF (cytidylyltransferase family)